MEGVVILNEKYKFIPLVTKQEYELLAARSPIFRLVEVVEIDVFNILAPCELIGESFQIFIAGHTTMCARIEKGVQDEV